MSSCISKLFHWTRIVVRNLRWEELCTPYQGRKAFLATHRRFPLSMESHFASLNLAMSIRPCLLCVKQARDRHSFWSWSRDQMSQETRECASIETRAHETPISMCEGPGMKKFNLVVFCTSLLSSWTKVKWGEPVIWFERNCKDGVISETGLTTWSLMFKNVVIYWGFFAVLLHKSSNSS